LVVLAFVANFVAGAIVKNLMDVERAATAGHSVRTYFVDSNVPFSVLFAVPLS
jgi:hypothetical protein